MSLTISAVPAGLVTIRVAGQVPDRFGIIAVPVAVPCVGAVTGPLNGPVIVHGRLQPFIVTLAMMVGAP